MSRGQAEWTRLTVRDAQCRRVPADVSEWMRVELAERAVSDPTERNLLAFALYLRARREHLALFCAGCAGNDYSTSRRTITEAWIIILGWILLLSLLSGLGGHGHSSAVGVLILVGLLSFFTWWCFWLGLPPQARRSRELLTKTLARQCPHCGYFLRKLNEIDPSATRYIEVGPRCCPECAMLWPLVPPPTHEEVVATSAAQSQR